MDFYKYLFSIIGILVFTSCNQQRDIKYNSEMKCFNWDSLKVVHLNESQLKKYFNYNFKVINDKIIKRMLNKGEVEVNQESWSYILFYNKGILLNDILAIHDHDLYLTTYDVRSKISRNDAVFLIGYKSHNMTQMHSVVLLLEQLIKLIILQDFYLKDKRYFIT